MDRVQLESYGLTGTLLDWVARRRLCLVAIRASDVRRTAHSVFILTLLSIKLGDRDSTVLGQQECHEGLYAGKGTTTAGG